MSVADRINLIVTDRKPCEWAKIRKGLDDECGNVARIMLDVKGVRLGAVCWKHADVIMAVAGLTVSQEDGKRGFALWKKDTAELRFKYREETYEVTP